MILRTTNGGVSWTELAGSLDTRIRSRIVSSGGIVGDNLGQFYGEVVFSIAPSEVQSGLIWAGTNDGKVWYTRDAGKNWNDVTKNITGLPAWGVVSKIEPSHFDAGTAYICVDFHLMDNRDPWIYKTTDFGKTWTKISDGLPTGPLAYARVIAENPNKKGNAVRRHRQRASTTRWTTARTGSSCKTGLPAAPVSWVVVQKQAHDLVLSTYGRGFYIMEDITPLEQGVMELDSRHRRADVRTGGAASRVPHGPRRPRAVELLAEGRAQRSGRHRDPRCQGRGRSQAASGTGRAGLNRVSWDLHYEAPRRSRCAPLRPRIRTSGKSRVSRTQDSRPITHWGLAQAEVGPIAAPGKYTVKLTVDGQTYTQPLEILRTPDSHGSRRRLQSSVRLQLKVRDDITAVSDMTNQIEWMRKQLEDQQKTVAGQGGPAQGDRRHRPRS